MDRSQPLFTLPSPVDPSSKAALGRIIAATSSAAVEELLCLLIQYASKLVPCKRVSISLLDEDATYFLVDREDGQPILVHVHPISPLSALIAEFEKAGWSMLTTNLTEVGEALARGYKEPWGDSLPVTYVPLLDLQDLLAILNLQGWDSSRAPEALLSQVTYFADLTLLSIKNARLVARYREAELRYLELADEAGCILFTIDTFGQVSGCNSYAQQILGYPPGALRGTRFLDLLTPQRRGLAMRSLKGGFEGRNPIGVCRMELLHKNGGSVPVDITIHTSYNVDRLVEWQVVAREVNVGDTSANRQGDDFHTRLALLTSIPLSLGQSVDPTVIFRSALDMALQIVPAEAGCFHLIDPTDRKLKIVAHAGLSQECLQAIDGLSPGDCLAGKAFQSDEAIVVRSLAYNPEVAPIGVVKERMRSAISVPLKSKGHLLGTVSVCSRGDYRFSAQDRALLTVASHYVSSAIETSRLYEDSRRQTQSMNRAIRCLETTSRTLSAITSGIQAAADAIAQGLAQFTDLELVGVFYSDPDGRSSINLVGRYPQDAENLEVLSKGLLAFATRTKSEIIVDDFQTESRFEVLAAISEHKLRSGVCIPLLKGETLVGALVAFARGGRSSQQDVRVLKIFASQAVSVLRNCALYGKERETIEELTSLNAIVNTQNQLLQRSEWIHQRFTDAALHGAGVPEIAEILAGLVASPVLVVDRFFKLVARAAASVDLDAHHFDTLTRGSIPSEVMEDPRIASQLREMRNEKRKHTILQPFSEHGMDLRRIVAPVVVGDDTVAYIVVVESRRELEEIDFRAVEQAATVIALEMQRGKTALEVEERFKGSFMRDLLMERWPVDEESLYRARKLGYDLSAVERVLVAEMDDIYEGESGGVSPWSHASWQRVLFEAARSVSAGLAYISLMEDGEHPILVLLLLADRSHGEKAERKARELAELISAKAKTCVPETSISIGVGGSCSSIGELGRSYLEATRSLQLMRSFAGRGQIAVFDELGIAKLLLGSERRPDMGLYADQILKPLRDYDRRHRSELLQTMEVWFEHNCNQLETARAAFVHVSTLKYRLKKVEQLCHLDLSSPDARLSLQVALKIARVRESFSHSASVR